MKKLLLMLKEANLFHVTYSVWRCCITLDLNINKNQWSKITIGERSGHITTVAHWSWFLLNMKAVDMNIVIWLDQIWVNSNSSNLIPWTKESIDSSMLVPLGCRKTLMNVKQVRSTVSFVWVNHFFASLVVLFTINLHEGL